MKLEFEYGQGLMAAELPENTDVFIPGVTVADPPCIPEEELEAKTLESIRNPIGMPPLTELARKDELEETMFLGLRKAEGVLLTKEISEAYQEVFPRLEQQGLLIRENGRARLTDLGIDVSNYALAEFL